VTALASAGEREIISSGGVFSREKQLSQKQETLENRMAKLEEKLTRQSSAKAPPASRATASPAVSYEHRIKVGVVFNRLDVPDRTASDLSRAARNYAKVAPVVFISPTEISDALSRTPCAEKRDISRCARELATYPGLRMLVLVESIRLPKVFPGEARATLHMFDPFFQSADNIAKVEANIKSPSDVAPFLRRVMETALDRAVEKSGLTPWFCRVFSGRQGEWYVNAGKLSGLKAGDRLKIVAQGTRVKAPSGQPAGWIPGPSKGVLEVQTLFGKDLAACRLVSGKEPTLEDVLLKQD